METTFCINIPLPSSYRGGDETYHRTFLLIDENSIIYPAGNSLQITPIFAPSSSSREIPKTNTRFPVGGMLKVIECDSNLGLSCYCFNRRLRRIAYSPKKINPSIFVWSCQKHKMLCKIEDGVKLEYADISFNEMGSKIVAVGRGEIDANVFVWSLNKETEQDESLSKLPFTATLFAKTQLSYSVIQCLFDPTDDNQIALLHQDRESISICKLTHISGTKVQYQEKLFTVEELSSSSTEVNTISTFIWENHHKLLVGMSDSSIYSISESGEGKRIWTSDNGVDFGEVIGILLTHAHVIVGFKNGKLFSVQRNDLIEEEKVNVHKALSVDDQIISLECDPSFQKVIVLTRQGNLMNFPLDDDAENNVDSNSPSCTKIAKTHHCLISSLCSVILSGKGSVTLFVSGGFDGQIRVYQDSSVSNTSQHVIRSAITSLDVGSPVTSLATLRGNPVCAVGSSDGFLRFVHLGKSKDHKETFGDGSVNLIVLKSEILTDAPITSLQFAPQTKKLVAACYQSGQAFIICAEPTNLHVLGIVQTIDKAPICSTSWSYQTDFHLFIGSKNGSLACYDTSSMCFSPEPLKPIWGVNAGIQCVKGILVIEEDDRLIANIAHVDINGFDSFRLEKENDTMVLQNEQRFEPFSKIVSFMSADGGLLLVASMSGEFAIFQCRNNGSIALKRMIALHSCPVLSVTLSSDHSRIYSTSIDGAICVSSIGAPQTFTPSAYEYDYLLPKNPKRKYVAIEALDTKLRDDSGRRMTWMYRATKQLNAESEREAAGTKKIIHKRIDGIRKQFQKLLLENEALDEENRLDDDELIIDLTEDSAQRDKINSHVESYATKVKRQADHDNDDLKRIKSFHIENRDAKFHQIFSVLHSSEPFSVKNFPIKSLSDAEKRVLKIVANLRKNEIVEMQRNHIRAGQDGMSWSTYLQNSLEGTPRCLSDDIRSCFQELTLSREDNQKDMLFDVSQTGEVQSYKLLYPQLSLRTKSQRITQMLLVRHSSRNLMTTYNEKFMAVQYDKKLVIDQVLSNLKRIDEIAEDINIVPTFKKHHIVDDIIPGTYDSMRKAPATDDKNVERKQHSLSPTSKRGLEQIMNGTVNYGLEQLMNGTINFEMMVDNSCSPKIDELCVDDTSIDKESMNEVAKESKTLQRNAQLSKEFKRLETDIHNLSKGLNEQLLALNGNHSRVCEVQRSNELYYVLLAKSLIQDQELKRSIAELEVKKDIQTQARNQFYKEDYMKVKEEYDSKRRDLLQKINHNKSLDKTFKKDLLRLSGEEIDRETMHILHDLFRKREEGDRLDKGETFGKSKRSKIGRQSGRTTLPKSKCSANRTKSNSESSEGNHGTLSFVNKMKQAVSEAKIIEEDEEEFCSFNDPFADITKVNESKDKVARIQLTLSDLPPDGFEISKSAWSSMLQLRTSKIASELMVEDATELMTKANNMIEFIERKDNELSSSIEALESKIKELQQKKRIGITSPCMILHAKQGQVKVAQPSFEDAIVLPATPVSVLNAQIQTLLNDKKKLTKKTCYLQRELKKLDCENELLRLKEAHEKELHVDFQLMHLSNELKYMLNGETNDMKVKESQIEDQLSSKLSACAVKLKKLKYEQRSLTKTIRERSVENVKLGSQLESLRNAVEMKEDDAKIVASGRESNIKMKTIMQRSKLIETVKKQGAEICNLRTELDKLRQKTFPSFSA